MDNAQAITSLLNSFFTNDAIISIETIFSVIFVTLILSVYEYFVYSRLSHRALYSKAFHTGITVIPFFIATIILCLQSNLIITLGTIGALAIIRFRTAVKDPIDMIYILWAIHIGICCGCQLYVLAIVTSLIVTLILGILDYMDIPKTPYTLVINCNKEDGDSIIEQIRPFTQKLKAKSRNYDKEKLNMILEVMTKDLNGLCDNLSKQEKIERFSIIEYDYEDII